MENLQSWMVLAGILVAALAMYALAWRIVEGTHIVVRAVTRVLLGALIAVPAILFFVFGDGAPMGDKVSAPTPVGASRSEDAAKPEKKKAAAPQAERKDDAAIAEQAAQAAKAEQQKQAAEAEARARAEAQAVAEAQAEAAKRDAEVQARRAEAERSQAAETQARQRAAEAEQAAAPERGGEIAATSADRTEDNRRALDEFLARRDAENAAVAHPPTQEEAADTTEIKPAASAVEEPRTVEEAPSSAAAPSRSATKRYYKRSYGSRAPAGANGGSAGGAGGPGDGIGGLDAAGSGSGGGANLTLDDLAAQSPAKPASPEATTATRGVDLDSVTNLGVPGRGDEAAGAAAPRSEPPPELAAMPDASPPDTAPGTDGSAAPDAADRAPEVAAMETAPPDEADRAPDVAAMETAPPPAAGAPTAADQEKQDWSVVPVFYGTDRARADEEKRIGYDWQRGRRMELGRALVTIPKEHVVPMVERPWALKIPYVDIVLYEAAEDPKKHFTMKELKALTKEEFLNLVKERLQKSARFKDHALVFIHGYKTKFDNAIYRTAQIAYDLKFDGAPFLYSWPSGGTLQGYTYDRESAAQAEIYLRQFLEMVRDEAGAKKLSIIAHSMGNQLLLRTLQDMKRSMPEGVQISQLILAAPDVDRDSFEHIVKSIEGIAEGITLYAASNDTALSFSRRVNGGIPRAGDVPDGGPIVMEGIDTIDATATSMDSVGINHSGYAENNALLEDIGKLVAAGIRPPGIRLPKLERVETDKGAYWRYPPKQP